MCLPNVEKCIKLFSQTKQDMTESQEAKRGREVHPTEKQYNMNKVTHSIAKSMLAKALKCNKRDIKG